VGLEDPVTDAETTALPVGDRVPISVAVIEPVPDSKGMGLVDRDCVGDGVRVEEGPIVGPDDPVSDAVAVTLLECEAVLN